MLLGCIADDSTGATDLAAVLVQEGMRTVQTIGVPAPGTDPGEVDALVVALKSRSIPAAEAVRQSLDALRYLQERGARQILFKYCSTFDSTPEGNIGPVAEALMAALGTEQTIVCPAYPTLQRSIFRGHLFVGDRLLNESGMEKHPLNPMTDADLVRVMAAQSRRKVGLVRYDTVHQGADAVRRRMAELAADGIAHLVTDVTDDADLRILGEAAAELQLVTGGSGIALGLPENFRKKGLLGRHAAGTLPEVHGLEAVLAGSCSVATRGQVADFKSKRPAFRLDPQTLADGDAQIEAALAFAAEHMPGGPVLLYATAEPGEVAAAQAVLGRERAGELVERAMGLLAKGLVERGVRRLVVAGGETSGSVMAALGVSALRIGEKIDPGVPATVSIGDEPLALALKSGNFGTPDFLTKAFGAMPGGRP
ncbi:MAG TPA: 3-oxo-tetronate kinase [Geminicoccus sp.]|uniref:3-oxo-tetronate kinase n=1 Tax=Geminicoccus sp. TaxID=2024832 RepID=UPI002C318CB6|nr:3-oxo-tetronate kinase [Geminicoccus sp.]HWL71722.1 3-oxo-tetronate kinase [Geminicoccus sp.]